MSSMSSTSRPAPLPAWLVVSAWTAVFLPGITLLVNPMPPMAEKEGSASPDVPEPKAEFAMVGGLQAKMEAVGRRSRQAQEVDDHSTLLQLHQNVMASAPEKRGKQLDEPFPDELLQADDNSVGAVERHPCSAATEAAATATAAAELAQVARAHGAAAGASGARQPESSEAGKTGTARPVGGASFASIADKLWNSIACRRRSGTFAAAIIGFGLLQTGLKPAVLLSV
mmetsp:Transcript_68451/g.198520  ORF Transcript_68451/g.198520 Transcript_68451/m.198520 type:complete len:227 (+) Transcript_68451:74-754(+)